MFWDELKLPTRIMFYSKDNATPYSFHLDWMVGRERFKGAKQTFKMSRKPTQAPFEFKCEPALILNGH